MCTGVPWSLWMPAQGQRGKWCCCGDPQELIFWQWGVRVGIEDNLHVLCTPKVVILATSTIPVVCNNTKWSVISMRIIITVTVLLIRLLTAGTPCIAHSILESLRSVIAANAQISQYTSSCSLWIHVTAVQHHAVCNKQFAFYIQSTCTQLKLLQAPLTFQIVLGSLGDIHSSGVDGEGNHSMPLFHEFSEHACARLCMMVSGCCTVI